MTGLRRVNHRRLEEFVSTIFVSVGFSQSDAELVAKTLVDADLRGVESHGVMRIPVYIKRIKEELVRIHSRGEVLNDSAATATIDAGNGMGQLMAHQGMTLAIEKAKKYGVGVVGIKHSNHYGTAGFYARMAAEQGLIGLSFTNTLPIMPPPGGSEPVVGNNPLAIAIPASRYRDVVLDMAMSAAAVGKVMMALRKGEQIPEGWAYDTQGNITTDPAEALKAGTYVPIGGPKGFGLAFAIDVLCGAIMNSAVGSEVKSMTFQWTDPVDCGHLMIALNIESFIPISAFREKVDSMIDGIKQSRPTQEGHIPMYPGEPEHLREQERRQLGIPIADKVYEDLMEVATELGIDTANANLESLD